MKSVRRAGFVLAIALTALAGCEATRPGTSAPPVTAAMVKSGIQQHADERMLTSGRSLFVGRCARCHALPAVGSESTEEWPQIVAEMSKRAGLNASQRKAVVAYILAAQSIEL